MKITPLGNRYLIELEPVREKMIGKLVLVGGEKKANQLGIVVACGSDTTGIVKIGDKVMFEKYAGDEIEEDKKHYVVIEEGDLIAIYG